MLKKIFFIFTLTLSLFASEGNVDKGLTYYKYIVRPMIDIKGSEFTKKHLTKEWKDLFKNSAEGFKNEYSVINSDFASFLKSEKFNKIAPDLEAFFIHYAKDSSVSPQCGDDTID